MVEKVRATRDYLRQWLERFRKAQHATPFVLRGLERTHWQLAALEGRPPEAHDIPIDDLETQIERDYDYYTRILPMIPDFDLSVLAHLEAVNTSSTASTYVTVVRIGGLGTPAAREYAERHTRDYRRLQTEHSRPQEVRRLLERLGNPQTPQRLDRASDAVTAVKSGTGERTAAASEIRTLLDGVQGDLFLRARTHAKEKMHWERMAERLSIGGIGGTEHAELVNQGAVRSSLVCQLSSVLKDREGGAPMNLDDLWTQALDHVYVVLGLVDL